MASPQITSPPSPDWAPPSGPPVVPPPPARRAAQVVPGPPRPASKPDPAAVRRAALWVGRFTLLLLASLVCSSLRLPWQAAAVVFSLAAVVVGVLAVRACVRARLRSTAVVFTVVGVVMAALMVLGQAALLALWPVQVDLQECQADALTLSAKQACQQDYDRRLEDLTHLTDRLS